MFELETLRLIKKSFRRFLTLTLIVMIGAGFMMGLISTSQIMRESVDVYTDANNLQDLQIYSPYGFCKEDYQFLSELDGVDSVFASKEIDLYAVKDNGDIYTSRVSELFRKNNTFELVTGRMPLKNDECIILSNTTFNEININDVLTLDYDDKDVFDYLKNDKYTVVGTFKSPEYLSNVLGSSTMNNETLNTVILIPNGNFIFDYYTTMYLTLDGSKDIVSFSKEYDSFIRTKQTQIENSTLEQQNFLKEKVIESADEELKKNTALLDEMKEKGQSELDDAKAQLDEARNQIIAYEAQLASVQQLINTIQSAINQDKPILDAIYDNTVLVEEGLEDLLSLFGFDAHIHSGSAAIEYTNNAYNNAISQFNSLKAQLENGKRQYESGLKQYQDAQKEFDTRIENAEHELKLAKQQLDELPEAKWIFLNRDKQYSSSMYKNTVKQMKNIGIYLPIMFFLVAALVCLTTMKRLVDEQRGQIGIFVALGFTRRQIMMKYILYALLASLVGGVIGIVFGQPLFPSVIYTVWRLMYNLPPIRIHYPIKYVLLTLMSFSVLMGGVTAYVVYDVLNDVPASLMRPKAPKKAKGLLIEKITFLWNNLSFTSKITARNLFRYKSRFLMTVIGIAGCTGLLVLGFGIKDSISDVLIIQYGGIFDHNNIIYLESSENMDENLKILRNNPDNSKISPYMTYMTKIYMGSDDDNAHVIVIDPKDFDLSFNINRTDKKTPITLSNDGVVISEMFAKNHNLKQGDTIKFESAKGIKADFVITDICEMYLQHYLFISDSLYESAFGEKTDNKAIAVYAENRESFLRNCSQLKDLSFSMDFASIIKDFNSMIQALNYIIVVIIIVAGALAFVVLMNLTQVNISERVREIATLKVLGFNDHEINMYIFKEIILLSFIGSILGFPVGILEHRFIMNALTMENIMFGTNIEPISFLYAFIITMIFTVIVLMFMRKPLKQVDMVESLKSVE